MKPRVYKILDFSLPVNEIARRVRRSPAIVEEARVSLGRVADKNIAKMLGVSDTVVGNARRALGIPSIPRSAWAPGFPRMPRHRRNRRLEKLDYAKLGQFPDAVLAKEYGVTAGVIRGIRVKYQIPTCVQRGRGTGSRGGWATIDDVAALIDEHEPTSPREIASKLWPPASIRTVHRALDVLVREGTAERVRRGNARAWGYVKRRTSRAAEEHDEEDEDD